MFLHLHGHETFVEKTIFSLFFTTFVSAENFFSFAGQGNNNVA